MNEEELIVASSRRLRMSEVELLRERVAMLERALKRAVSYTQIITPHGRMPPHWVGKAEELLK